MTNPNDLPKNGTMLVLVLTIVIVLLMAEKGCNFYMKHNQGLVKEHPVVMEFPGKSSSIRIKSGNNSILIEIMEDKRD